jgi:hypothetical protein
LTLNGFAQDASEGKVVIGGQAWNLYQMLARSLAHKSQTSFKGRSLKFNAKNLLRSAEELRKPFLLLQTDEGDF